jgi:hypothetical protein
MGKIELDHTGSGSGITLSSDGTDLLLDGTAVGGGGGADLYAAETTGSTDPTATGTLSLAIGSSANGSGTNAVAIGNGATAGTYSVGIGWNAGNTGTNNVIIGRASAGTYNQGATVVGYNASSSGYSSNQTALGYNSKANSGAQATALTNSYASGTDSFAAAIASNSSSYGASGANSVAIGDRAKATASDSFAIGNVATASAAGASVLGGQNNTASGSNSTAIGGGSNTASGDYSTAKGYYGNANGIRLKHATGVYPNQQGAYYVLGYTTSDATAIALNTSVWTPNSTNQIVLPNNSAFAFHGTVVAREQAADGTDCAAWKIEGLIRREGSASTTTLVNSAITVLDNTPSWGLALSADTTNGCLKIQATGAAATDIRWVATIHTSEVTYA